MLHALRDFFLTMGRLKDKSVCRGWTEEEDNLIRSLVEKYGEVIHMTGKNDVEKVHHGRKLRSIFQEGPGNRSGEMRYDDGVLVFLIQPCDVLFL